MDLVSIVVPVYNVEKYLERCVDSIRSQTYTNLEIILVDDGATDSSGQMCDDLAQKDERIKVVHKENQGLGLARNSGLQVATGVFVTFVDSDDWIHETHIANLYNAAKENDADMVIGTLSVAPSNGEIAPVKLRINEGVYRDEKLRKEILLPLIGTDTDVSQDVQIEASCCDKLYKRDVAVKNNLSFPSEKLAVGEDGFFNIQFAYFSKCAVVVDEAGYYYFENTASITRKHNPQRYQRTLNFYTNMSELLCKYGLEDEAGFRADRTFLLKMRTALRLVVVSDMKRKEKFKEIRKYLENDTVVTVLSRYPIETLIPAMRLLTKMMKRKNVSGVYHLVKFRESAKKKGALKKLLRSVGIGR